MRGHVKEKKKEKGGRFRVRVLLNEKEYLFFFFWQFFILVLFHFFVVTNFVEIFLVCVCFFGCKMRQIAVL